MEVLHPGCAGLDVHKDTVVACTRIQGGSTAHRRVETFGTTTTALLALSDWLGEQGVTHVAMEATGVYWKPIWHVLEGSFELVLANAMHIKNVPGRKTDVNDATWIADLLAHGLIRASFVPPTPILDLRALTRTRRQLARERAQHVLRIQKTLEDANIKFASVTSSVIGTSGRAILRALIEGETDPEALLAVTTGRLRASRQTLIESLQGRVRAHHRFLLKLHLEQVEAMEQAIETVDVEVGSHLDPFRGATARLVTMPGISDATAQVIVSEIGDDMGRARCPVAQNHPRPGGMACGAHQEQLPASPILPSQEPPGAQESHRGCGRIDAHIGVSHAARRRRLPRSRPRPL